LALGEIQTAAMVAIGNRLSSLTESPHRWSDWIDIAPVIPNIVDRLKLSAIEEDIATHLGYLESVSMRPRSHLQVEIERVPVSRARRIAKKAGNYLASHPEDWERPTLRSVLPKRILAQMRHHEYDIYENRVAARLIDVLRSHLTLRIVEVESLLRLLQDAQDYSNEVKGTIWLQRRICSLWRDLLVSNEGLRIAENTLASLRGLRYRILALLGSPLYTHVPRRAKIDRTLKSTNILASDANYKHVAILWKAWSKRGTEKRRTPNEAYTALQDQCRAFDAFAALLIVHALHQLGYAPASPDVSLDVGRPVELNGPSGSAQMMQNKDGTVSMKCVGGRSVLRFAAMTASLTTVRSPSLVLPEIDAMDARVRAKESCCVLMHLSPPTGTDSTSPSGDYSNRLQSIALKTDRSQPSGLVLVPVSPWEIHSVERVARVIRWALDGSRFLAYPPTISPFPDVVARPPSPVPWILQSDKTHEWKLLRLPRGNEEAMWRPQNQIEELKRSVGSVRSAVARAPQNSRQRTMLKQRLDEAERKLTSAEAWLSEYEDGVHFIEGLLHCPVCHSTAGPFDMDAGGGLDFRCKCPNCDTTWGTLACGHCQEHFPFIRPHLTSPTPITDESPTWVDEVFGCDVLAIPKPPVDQGHFVCPHCGA